jgi:hypothetical protein
MKLAIKSITILLVIFIILSCNKSSFVGSDLFTPDSIELLFKDDFEITAKTLRVDSVQTTDGLEYSEYLINGMLNDPIFGTTVAETYIDLHISNTYPNFKYLDENGETQYVTIDSAIMVLGLYPDGFYGDTLTPHTITVSQMVNKVPEGDPLYSTFQPEIITFRDMGSVTIIPSYIDSVAALEPGDSVPTMYDNQLRIPLNKNIFEALVLDTSLVISDANFVEYFPGIRISSVPENGNSVWGMDLTRTSTQPYNNIVVYYKRGEGRGKYHIFVDSHRHNYFNQNYEGAVVNNVFGDETIGNETLYLQGMTGPNIEIDIPELSDDTFKDFLINKAELEFWVKEGSSDDTRPPLDAIGIYRYDEDGELIEVEDYEISIRLNNEVYFDGNSDDVEENGVVMKKYTALLSIYALGVMNGEIEDTRLVITAKNKINTPKRSVIIGPGDENFPMKFKLAYSK